MDRCYVELDSLTRIKFQTLYEKGDYTISVIDSSFSNRYPISNQFCLQNIEQLHRANSKKKLNINCLYRCALSDL